MADTYAAKPEGLAGWSPRRPIGTSGFINPLTRAKLSSSTFNIWKGSPVINATGGTCDLAAVVGTNEVQTITGGGTISGGTYTITSAITGTRRGGSGLTFAGTTSALAYNATASDVQSAMDAILGVGNVVVTGGPVNTTALTFTFIGDLSATDVAALTYTSSLTGTSPTLTVATPTAGVVGRISSTVLIGFAAEYEAGSITNWPRNFGLAPLNLEGPFASTTKEILIHPDTAGQVYCANIWPTEVVATSMVGTSYDIGYNVSTGQFYVRTGSTANTLVTVVGIQPGEVGKVGGKVDFIVKDGASIFH